MRIDKLLRTHNAGRVERDVARPNRLPRYLGGVLSFVSHTKVLISASGHFHAKLYNPVKGMARAPVGNDWGCLADLLANRTLSCNRRDLESVLYGANA